MEAFAPPLDLQKLIDGYRWERTSIGQSDARVYRLTSRHGPPLFVKVRPSDDRQLLKCEARRLEWLDSVQIDAPSMVHVSEEDGFEWLQLTAVPGDDAAQARIQPDEIVHIMANALQRLHGVDVHACPFDETLDSKISRAEANVIAGKVDETDFDDDHVGSSARELFEKMLALRPDREELVVTHGDACLPNFMIDDKHFSGFVDCGSLGRADHYQDLALACRSIEYNLGRRWIQPFLVGYGLNVVDPVRMYFCIRRWCQASQKY